MFGKHHIYTHSVPSRKHKYAHQTTLTIQAHMKHMKPKFAPGMAALGFRGSECDASSTGGLSGTHLIGIGPRNVHFSLPRCWVVLPAETVW